ncbi:hypothetical protein SRHO_G00257990 [Serrasalmus rhombeus]
MVWTGVLKAALLLSLLSSGIRDVEGLEPVDLTALQHIVRVINVHANRAVSQVVPTSGPGSGPREDVQYAMAVRITKNQCLQGFDGQGLGPLKTEVDNFKNTLNTKDVYERQMVIAAKPQNQKYSEYRLLIENEGKVIKKLLERREGRNDEDCVIFYTYNSPCLKTCLNEEEDNKKKERDAKRKNPKETYRCIYSALDVFNEHHGPKALVFSQIYREDMNKIELSECLSKIAVRIPLIQCDNNNRCRHCKQDNQYCTDAGADLAG